MLRTIWIDACVYTIWLNSDMSLSRTYWYVVCEICGNPITYHVRVNQVQASDKTGCEWPYVMNIWHNDVINTVMTFRANHDRYMHSNTIVVCQSHFDWMVHRVTRMWSVMRFTHVVTYQTGVTSNGRTFNIMVVLWIFICNPKIRKDPLCIYLKYCNSCCCSILLILSELCMKGWQNKFPA